MGGLRLRIPVCRRPAGHAERGCTDHARRLARRQGQPSRRQVLSGRRRDRGAETIAGERIPLWVAGGGEKVTLKIAARYAQYTNFTSEPDGFRHKSEVLQAHCRDVGTDYGAIVRSSNFNAVVGSSEAEVNDRVERIRARQIGRIDAEAVESMLSNVTSPDSASGTPEQIVERLSRMRDLGCEYAILYFPEAAYDRSGIELFEREVIPALS